MTGSECNTDDRSITEGRERQATVVGWARVRGLKDDVLKTSDFSLRLSR